MLYRKQRYGLLAKTLNLEISRLSFERLFQRNIFQMHAARVQQDYFSSFLPTNHIIV